VLNLSHDIFDGPGEVTELNKYLIQGQRWLFFDGLQLLAFFWYNVQNHAIPGMDENGHIWFSSAPNEGFSHFFQHKNHVLDVEKICSLLVGFVTECALRCTTHVLCLSFNIKEGNTENRRQITCELLPKDMYNASRKFKKSEEFHHWSAIVRFMFNCCPLHYTYSVIETGLSEYKIRHKVVYDRVDRAKLNCARNGLVTVKEANERKFLSRGFENEIIWPFIRNKWAKNYALQSTKLYLLNNLFTYLLRLKY